MEEVLEKKKERLREVKRCRDVCSEESRQCREQLAVAEMSRLELDKALQESRLLWEQQEDTLRNSLKQVQKSAHEREKALLQQLDTQQQEKQQWTLYKKEKRQHLKQQAKLQIEEL